MDVKWIFIQDRMPGQYGAESALIGNIVRSIFAIDIDEESTVDVCVSPSEKKSLLELHNYLWSFPADRSINIIDLTGLDGGEPISEWLKYSFSQIENINIYGTNAGLLSKTRDKLLSYQILMGHGISVLPHESSCQGDDSSIIQWLQYCEFEGFQVTDRYEPNPIVTYMSKEQLKSQLTLPNTKDILVMADLQYQPHYAIMPAHPDLQPLLISKSENGWDVVHTDKGDDLLSTAKRVWDALGVERAFLSIELFNDSLSSRVVDVRPTITETVLNGLLSVSNKYQWKSSELKKYLFGQ